jgi:hypothetical protein
LGLLELPVRLESLVLPVALLALPRPLAGLLVQLAVLLVLS